MQRSIESAKEDVDLVLFVIDAHEGLGEKDKNLVKKFSSLSIPTIIVLSKIDITPESLLVAEIKELGEICENIVPISARKGKNLKELKKVIVSHLPEGERLFSEDIISDRSEKFMIKEIMREKILLKFQAEIPHGVAIIVNQFSLRENGQIYDINLDIVCEKPNHKAILIGKNGSAIREVSSFARQEMEKFLGKKVFLTTYVKVEENWRDSAYLLKEHGYTEEN
jgi:GTP-binding protein Era